MKEETFVIYERGQMLISLTQREMFQSIRTLFHSHKKKMGRPSAQFLVFKYCSMIKRNQNFLNKWLISRLEHDKIQDELRSSCRTRK